MNNKLPEYLLGKYQLIGTVTFSVLFALVFLNIYIPFSETAWFGLGDSVMFQRTLIYVLAATFTLIISRRLMYKSKGVFDMTFLMYIIWCICEILSVCGLYTWLTIDLMGLTDETAWEIFRRACIYGMIALGVPYIISGMYFAIIDKNNTIRLMNYENVVTDEPVKPEAEKQKITLLMSCIGFTQIRKMTPRTW